MSTCHWEPEKKQKVAASERPDFHAVCAEIADILTAKNTAYGNSVFDPVRIFSKASVEEQIKVRIDDKLSRLVRSGGAVETEDVVLDLIGYLIILRMALRA